MAFAPGDLVHVASVGKGTVREVRNGGSYLVEVHGRSVVTTADRLTPQESPRKSARRKPSPPPTRTPDATLPVGGPVASLDLHGNTADEALDAVNRFLNAALLAGSPEVRIIHGRSGGKLKATLHSHLRRFPSIRGFALDPRNPGVTIVKL